MLKAKRILMIAMIVIVTLAFFCPAFVSAESSSNDYLYDITSRLDIKDGYINQPSGVAQGYPLQYTVVVLSGRYDSWDYDWHNGKTGSNASWQTGECTLLHSESLTYVLLSGEGDWYRLRYDIAPLAVYLLVQNSYQDGAGQIRVTGSSSEIADFSDPLYFAKNAVEPYSYVSTDFSGFISTQANPLLTDFTMYITGTFTDLYNFRLDSPVPYEVTFFTTIHSTPGYSFSFNGNLSDTVTLSGTSHQTGDSTIHDGDIIMKGTVDHTNNTSYDFWSGSSFGDIDITVPDSNVDLSGTVSLDASTITATGIPLNAVSRMSSSVVIRFDGVPTGNFSFSIGHQWGEYVFSASLQVLTVRTTYLMQELPQSQSTYLGSIYRALYGYVNDFDQRVVQELQTNWTQNQKPFYQQWFEKFVAIFDRGADEEAKSDFSQAENKLSGVASGLAQSPSLETDSIDFSAPAIESNNLLLVVIDQAWEVPFFLQCVAVIAGCVVLGFLLFGRRG